MNLCAALTQGPALKPSLSLMPQTSSIPLTIFQSVMSPKYFNTENISLDDPRYLENKAMIHIQEKYGLLESMTAGFSAIDYRHSAFRKGLSPIDSGIISTCNHDPIKGACSFIFCPLTMKSCPEEYKHKMLRLARVHESSTICFQLGYKFTESEIEIASCRAQIAVSEVPIEPPRLRSCR